MWKYFKTLEMYCLWLAFSLHNINKLLKDKPRSYSKQDLQVKLFFFCLKKNC